MRGGVPEDLARTAILRGGAFVCRRRVRDPEGAIREGDRVEVDLREPPPAELPRILHLDPLVLAVDKPAGVLAQEGRGGGPALPDLCSRLLLDRGGPRSLDGPDGRRLEFSRPLLHALALRVRHPEGHELSLRAPLPADLAGAVEFLAG